MELIRARIGVENHQEVLIDLNADDIDHLITSITHNKVYWNQENSIGFWTPFQKIRYINFIRPPNETSNATEETSISSNDNGDPGGDPTFELGESSSL